MIYVMSGGINLNFEVKYGKTAPTSPKENTIWVNTDVEVTSWDMSAEQPQRRSGNKNENVYPFYDKSKVSNGITWTDKGDGTITASGTATANSDFQCIYYSQFFRLEPGTYTLSGCPSGGGTSSYYIYVYDIDNSKALAYDVGSGRTFTITARTHINLVVRVASGTNGTFVFRPQLERSSVATSFVKGTAEGQLWLETISGDIIVNALKRGGIWLKLGGCKQYINGVWTGKVAQIYQGGAWKVIENTLFLFKSTDNTAITGGWTATGNNVSASSVTIKDGKITFKNIAGASDNGQWYVGPKNKIDLTDYKTLRVTIDSVTAVTNNYIGAGSVQTYGGIALNSPAAVKAVSGAGTYELDISEVSGSYYVGFGSYQNTNTDYTVEFSAWELNK